MSLIFCRLPYSNDSAELAHRFSHLDDFVFFDSGQPQAEQGRFDIISACATDKVLVDNTLALHHPKACNIKLTDEQACDFFESWFEPQNTAKSAAPKTTLDTPKELASLPFITGWLGQLDYELGSQRFKLEPHKQGTSPTYIGQLNYYSWSIVIDHASKACFLISQNVNTELKTTLSDVVSTLPQPVQKTFSTQISPQHSPQHNKPANASDTDFTLLHHFKHDTSKADYVDAFETIQNYIVAGDCYQVNLTQRFSSQYQGDCWQAYQALRKVAPAPYSGFMRLHNKTLASCSPELFLHCKDQHVTTKPIKGTTARLVDEHADQQQQQSLLNSDKDIAENIMIVDLLRNDLSQLCQPFSVQTPKCCELESFSNVHHLVSQVEGQLPDNTSPLALLLASFPGGSITGAPKKRAMEIIQELENSARYGYCGTLFSYDYRRNLQANILIRSLEFYPKDVYCWGGGGITIGSSAEDEYQESLTKIKPLLTTLETRFIKP